GLRFRPYITREIRNTLFANADSIALNALPYRGATIAVRVALPARGADRAGAYAVGSVTLNGQAMGDGYVTRDMLASENVLEVTLVDTPEASSSLAVVTDTSEYRNVFGPRTPSIAGLSEQGGSLELAIDLGGEDSADVSI